MCGVKFDKAPESMSGPSLNVASNPGEPSALIIGMSPKIAERASNCTGNRSKGVRQGRKPVAVVTVKGSAERGRLVASERMSGNKADNGGRGGESVRYVILASLCGLAGIAGFNT